MLPELFRTLLRTNIRGSRRATNFAARRVKSLQSVPLVTHGYPPVYVDLRMPGAIGWFMKAPFDSPPLELEQQVLMRRLIRDGDVVFDIGANIGLYAVFFSTLVGPRGRVFAFEANPELYDVLRRTVAGLDNCELFEFGLSDAEASGSLHVPENREMASLGDWTKLKVTRQTCTLCTLDGVIARVGHRPPTS